MTLDLGGIAIHDQPAVEPHRIVANVGIDTLNDGFSNKIATTLRRFIEGITPAVNAFEDSDNEEEV